MSALRPALVLAACGLAVACSAVMQREAGPPSSAQVKAELQASFKANGQAKLDRLDQDDVQRLCSQVRADKPLSPQDAQSIVHSQQATLRYPEGSLMGDWKNGEKVAQQGTGKQYTDDPTHPSGANCYACHQLSPHELSYGTIGPSLYRFGATHGYTPEMQKYVYGKVYNSEAFSACSTMPRFGHMGILTEQQIKDVVALLMDPKSPVNQ
ncbi:MAG TPA: sulfur oxidation c-type cytochrome SoxX [Usitatibacter sp.]|nr:sulfur oxidation c-type cytochrome SoxX [Usitatibacter sp.]